MSLTDIRPRRSARRRMNMFYLIDTSGSMNYNGCIQSVNTAMPEIVDILKDISDTNNDLGEIYLSCITFDNEARLLYDVPVAAGDFHWADVRAEGLTNLEAAFNLLEKQMHRDSGLSSNCGHLRPAVILLTDGDPDEGWEHALDKLRTNRWFRESYKIAIAIGAKSHNVSMKRALTKFAEPLDAGGPSMVINVTDLNRLRQVVKLVSSTVSRLGSQSTGALTPGNDAEEAQRSVGQEIHQTLVRETIGIDGVDIPASSSRDIGWL